MIARDIWACIVLVPLMASTLGPRQEAHGAGNSVKVIQDSLQQKGNFYYVKGSVYNSSEIGLKNVVIRYYIWKKWKGQDGHGSRIKDTGGLVSAEIKYLPPKQTVEFVAVGNDNAPVMMHDVPDTLTADISADPDQ